jgi:hypothetical protein
MHPFGFFAALLAADAERTRKARRPIADEPLPPLDTATIRAWRAWAHADPVRRQAGVAAPRPATAPASRLTAQRADRPA